MTLLLTAGTALALAVGNDDAVSGAAGQPSASTASTNSSTETTTDFSESSTSSPTHSTDPTGAPVEVIDSALAVQIALSYTGGGTVTNVEREFEHGRLEWKVRIETGGKRVDVRVDSATGAITRVDVDDRDGGDRDGGDHDGDDRDGRAGDDNSGPGSGDDSDNSGPGSGDDRSGSGGHGHDDPSGDDHSGRG
ncbi:MAG TPA: PepSY domain-containing protein [Actinomycetes bacterium]|nr:PepSY domain-containing protein [Actinomycetes bacterium]